MNIPSSWRRLTSWLAGVPSHRRTPAVVPALEALEDRCLLSLYSLDPSFNGTGLRTVAGAGPGYAAVVQPDSKIVLAGGTDSFSVTRLNPDGSLDTSFNGSGRQTIDFGPGTDVARALVLQPDGKIVLAGFAAVGSPAQDSFAFARLNPNGALDTTFDGDGQAVVGFTSGGPVPSRAYALALQPDGKLVAAGEVVLGGTNSNFAMTRLNPDGSLDTGFGTGGRQTASFDLPDNDFDQAVGVVVQPDGDLLVGGTAANFGFGFVRLLSSGAVAEQQRYGYPSEFVLPSSARARGMAVQPDGKIVLTGSITFASSPSEFVTTRILPDLRLDSAGFGFQGWARGFRDRASAEAVVLLPEGRILLAGWSEPTPGNAAFQTQRLLPDGTGDTSIGDDGWRTYQFGPGTDQAFAAALQPDGDLILAGVSDGNLAVARVVYNQWVVAAPDLGGPPQVHLVSLTGMPTRAFEVFGSTFTGGVRVASADVTGDGYPDILAAPGRGGLPYVNVFEGHTLRLVRQFQVFGLAFTGGVNLAVGNVLGAVGSPAEVLVAADRGGQPFVNVLDSQTGALLRSFLGYGETFTGGVRVSTGDLDGNGVAEVLVAPQAGGAPFVNVFNAETQALLRQFQVYGDSFTGGLFVAAGRLNATAGDDLIVGPDRGGVPYVNLFDGTTGALLRQDRVYAETFLGGVRVGAADYNADGIADLVVGPGAGTQPRVRVLRGDSGAELASFLAFDPAVVGGVFVVGVPR